MTTPATAEQLAAEVKRLAGEYAHCYAFVGDNSMPIKHQELHAAIDALAAMAKAAEVAEPAAEVEEYRLASCINAVGGYQTFPAEVRVKWNRPIPVVGTRLYTRPQQEPLTVAQIHEAADKLSTDSQFLDGFYEGASFAEREHGIGGAR